MTDGTRDPSPLSDATDSIHDEEGPSDGTRLLACLQAWAKQPEGRFHYRLRCSASAGQLPDASVLERRCAALPQPLPTGWAEALRRGWPAPLRGLHRIEVVPNAAWVSVAIGLEPSMLRRLRARWRGPQAPSAMAADAIVVGAGLAGCAMADALARRGWSVTVIEAGSRVGGAVADVPLLAQHPALSPGNDRRSRLLLSALLTTQRLAERFGASMTWCGRFQPMAPAEARRRTEGIPSSIAQAVGVSDAALRGVAGSAGIWFPGCAIADPQRWWQQLQREPAVTLRLLQPVATIARHSGRWHALDHRGETIASAPAMVLANQAQALTLAAMPALAGGRLRLNRIQVAIGTASGDRPAGRPTILGGSSYRLEDPGRYCVIGPLQPGRDTLLDHRIALPGLTINDPAYRWRLSEPSERLLLRDNLPMIGAAPDMQSILAECDRYRRNDRLPLPRREGLHLLTGLGGRGLLWSVLGAEIIAAALNAEPAVVEPDLEDAVDPGRLLKRNLRRGVVALPEEGALSG